MPVVQCLDEGLDQLNERFPKRSKKSDGAWGDKAHQKRASSHNGDKSGTPEYRDGDNIDEVRARDFDKDLNDPYATMEQVVQMWVEACRAGKMWWVRYIIFNGRIWHKKDGFKTRTYTGSNKHALHAHVNSDFTQKADTAKGTDWGLKNFRKPSTTPAKPAPPKKLPDVAVDGVLGPKTVKKWQQVTEQKQTGKMDEAFVRWLQTFLREKVNRRLKVDGDFGKHTIAALQSYLKSPVDGFLTRPKSAMVVSLQRRINSDKF